MEPKIEYTNNIDPKWGGYCRYFLFKTEIKIRPKYVNDLGIQHHELTHARQFGRLLWIHSILSGLSGKYRLLVELQAYREQVKHYNYTKKSQYKWIKQALYTKYKTGEGCKDITFLTDLMFEDLINITKDKHGNN